MRLETLPVDLDQLGGIFRDLPAVGDDECDPVANMACDATTEDRGLARGVLRPIRLRDALLVRHIAEMTDIVGGQDKMYAGKAGRRLRRNHREPGMGIGRTQDKAVQRTVHPEIVGITPRP